MSRQNSWLYYKLHMTQWTVDARGYIYVCECQCVCLCVWVCACDHTCLCVISLSLYLSHSLSLSPSLTLYFAPSLSFTHSLFLSLSFSPSITLSTSECHVVSVIHINSCQSCEPTLTFTLSGSRLCMATVGVRVGEVWSSSFRESE